MDCTGETKPIASSTRSAFMSNSEPGTSCIFPSFHSRRAATSFSILPFLPSRRLVATAQSRLAPSSCEDEVRSRSGQYGHTGFLSRSGGIGRSSNWVTDVAPWRFEVPTQSEPVSPPPMMTTCLPAATNSGTLESPATRRFCSGRKSIANITPPSSRPGTGRSRGCSAPPASTTASNSSVMVVASSVVAAALPAPSGAVPTT